jgi:hypothetical protein
LLVQLEDQGLRQSPEINDATMYCDARERSMSGPCPEAVYKKEYFFFFGILQGLELVEDEVPEM